MDTLKSLIEKADDDYLIGLCNKGTVKRACKDLEKETPALAWEGEEAHVTLKDETCVLKAPLGDSTCSCPSHSICRHIITAILWLKREAAGGKDTAPAADKVLCGTPPQETRVVEEGQAVQEKAVSQLLHEVLGLPVDRLKKACKARGFRQFLAHMRAGELPPMEESSVTTVTLPWENAVVKLLEPFAFSTCSCHSKELCSHKAQAALAYQIAKGKITLAELDILKEAENPLDETLVRQACQSVCESVCHQMCTGLSRQSPEITDSLERLAVIAHRAGLADLENRLREAGAYYGQYFSRSAAFRSGELLEKLLALYQKALRLLDAKGQNEIGALAGNFRDTYEPAGNLHLVGMGGRTFSSRTGYEGEIYYFLETRQKKWYTWTDARPVFYEGVRRRPPSGGGNVPAPWELDCSREQMQKAEFDLLNAKAAPGGRLSVSKESKGIVTGGQNLKAEALRQMVIWDYEELLRHCFAEESQNKDKASGRKERLALAGAVRWGETSFDPVQQRFSWSLYDRAGRKLFISLTYTKEERLVINLLERLEQRLRRRMPSAVVFFGSLYVDEKDRLCLYPIEFFLKDEKEIQPSTDVLPEPGEKGTALSAEILQTMEQYRREAASQLTDLFFSGLHSLPEAAASQFESLAEDAERLGLHQAGEDLSRISGLLKEKRHRMDFAPEPLLELLARMDVYLRACRRKLAFDRTLLGMQEGTYREGQR